MFPFSYQYLQTRSSTEVQGFEKSDVENIQENVSTCFRLFCSFFLFQIQYLILWKNLMKWLKLENPAQKSVSKLFATVQINKRSCAPDRVRPLDLHGHEEPALGDLVEVAPYVRPERPEPSGKFSDS